jgi:hypothetical protein
MARPESSSENGCEREEKMRWILRDVAETVLFVLLIAVVTGIWTCLWLPPF